MGDSWADDSGASLSPTPLQLAAFLPFACQRLQSADGDARFAVRVRLQQQDVYVSKTGEDKMKRAKSTTVHTSRTLESPLPVASPSGSDLARADFVLQLVAVRDLGGSFIELQMLRPLLVPRLLLKIIGMCVPFHPLLTKLTVRWAPLDSVAMYEMLKLLALSHITEVCLDDSDGPTEEYASLLEPPLRLRWLSLARCGLSDAAAAALAARLQHPRPAARQLQLLALPANRIGDAGARALAAALRSNRALQYLNLSGNRISDDGAVAIFDSLAEFPLTADELTARRRRRFEYLKSKDATIRKFYIEFLTVHFDRSNPDEPSRGNRRKVSPATPARGRKRPSASAPLSAAEAEALAARAEAAAVELLGDGADPFGAADTTARGGAVLAAGNTALCALGLAYNALGWRALARLAAVLRYQEALGAARAGAGLLRVLLEGNALPDDCAELFAVQDLLDKALASRTDKPAKSKFDKNSGRSKNK